MQNDHGAQQKSDDLKNQKENGRTGRKSWYLKTIHDRQHWRDKCGFWKTKRISAHWRKSEVLENYNTRGRYGRKCAFWKTTGTRMIVFENREKLRGSARKKIVFENAEKLRSAWRVIAKKSAFCKTMEYRGAGQDRQQKKRVFEKHRKSADDQEFSGVKR